MSRLLRNSYVRWSVLALSLGAFAAGCTAEATSEEDIASTSSEINVTKFHGWNIIPSGTFTSDPAAIVLDSSGTTEVYGKGFDNAIYYNFFSTLTGWIGWSSLGGALTSEPSAARWATNAQAAGSEAIVAAKGSDNKIWVNPTLKPPGGHPVFQGWRVIPGASTFASAPAITFRSPFLYAVARKSDSVVYWTRNDVSAGFTNAGWSAWTAIPGGVVSSRPAITTAGGTVIVAARGTDNQIWFTSTTSTSWAGWQSVAGGTFTSGPAIAAHGPNNVEVFGRGTDNAIWGASLNPSTAVSSGFSQIPGGTFTSGPASGAIDSSTGSLGVVARGFDNAYYLNSWQ